MGDRRRNGRAARRETRSFDLERRRLLQVRRRLLCLRRDVGRRLQRGFPSGSSLVDRLLEQLAKLLDVADTPIRSLDQTLADDPLDTRIRIDDEHAHRIRIFVRDLVLQRVGIQSGNVEGSFPRDQLVQDDRERPDIGALVERGRHELLRRHVRRRASDRSPFHRHGGAIFFDGLGADAPSDAEIGDDRDELALNRLDQDVRRLEVAVNDPRAMQRSHAIEHLLEEREQLSLNVEERRPDEQIPFGVEHPGRNLVRFERSLPCFFGGVQRRLQERLGSNIDPVAERTPADDVRHDEDEIVPRIHAKVDHLDHIPVIDRRGNARLAPKALCVGGDGLLVARRIRLGVLDRHLTGRLSILLERLEVLRLVDVRLAARTNRAQEAIPMFA